MQELDELQLRHFLINCKDVRFCPNAKCGYAGHVEINEDTQRIECSEALTCEKCGIKWRDPLLREPFSLSFKYFKDKLFGEVSSLESI